MTNKEKESDKIRKIKERKEDQNHILYKKKKRITKKNNHVIACYDTE
jgi:hypothetical protein